MKNQVHYTEQELQDEIDRLEFPDRFLFGTSTSGYQSEGGFNGPDEPKNNWYYVEKDGSMERTGAGSRFLEMYPEDLDVAARLECNAFRMGIEWSRIQPEVDPEKREAPPFDPTAIETYADIIAGCRQRGMEPLVTLFHFTHPLWMGMDPWLDRDRMLEAFNAYVSHTVTAVNECLVGRHGTKPILYYITLNEAAMVPLASYYLRVHPRGRGTRGRGNFATSFENFILAHVDAYERIHQIHGEKGWPKPTVTMNGWASALYPMDFMILDILHGPQKGMTRESVSGYLLERRKTFQSQVDRSPCKNRQTWRQSAVEKLISSLLEWRLGRRPMPRLVERVLAGHTQAPWMDALSFDYYDPFVGNLVDTSSPFWIRVRRDPWEWGLVPDGLGGFVDAYDELAQGMPIHILENGMSYAFRNGRGEPRPDGANRVDMLKAHLFHCLRARNRGKPLEAYCYWTLFDNYEWGSFVPRFGMLAVDYENGARRSPLDVVGNNAAGAYQAIVRAFFAKDKRGLKEAFQAESYPLVFPMP